MGEMRPGSTLSAPAARSPALRLALWAALAGATAMPHAAAAADQSVHSKRLFHIPAQELTGSLFAFARQADVQVVIDIPQGQFQSAAVAGKFTPHDALRTMLRSLPVAVEWSAPGTVLIRRAAVAPARHSAAEPISSGRRVPEAVPPMDIVVTARKRAEKMPERHLGRCAGSGKPLCRFSAHPHLHQGESRSRLGVTQVHSRDVHR